MSAAANLFFAVLWIVVFLWLMVLKYEIIMLDEVVTVAAVAPPTTGAQSFSGCQRQQQSFVSLKKPYLW